MLMPEEIQGTHTPPQFFIDPSWVEGSTVLLQDEAFRHAVTVRLKPGELFRAIVPGTSLLCEVREVYKDRLLGFIVASSPIKVPAYMVSLYAAILKGEKFDLVIEKASELGASEVVPVITARTIPRLDAEKVAVKLKRWQRIAQSASEQCARQDILQVRSPISFREALRNAPGLRLIACERGRRCTLFGEETSLPLSARVSVFVGPEGGFEDFEIDHALAQGFTPVTLGPNILRAETACIAALAIIIGKLDSMCIQNNPGQ